MPCWLDSALLILLRQLTASCHPPALNLLSFCDHPDSQNRRHDPQLHNLPLSLKHSPALEPIAMDSEPPSPTMSDSTTRLDTFILESRSRSGSESSGILMIARARVFRCLDTALFHGGCLKDIVYALRWPVRHHPRRSLVARVVFTDMDSDLSPLPQESPSRIEQMTFDESSSQSEELSWWLQALLWIVWAPFAVVVSQ